MAKYFSKIVDRYFMRWISPDTWHTHHPLDMKRFYGFVKALRRYSRKRGSPRLRANIIMAAKIKHPELDEECLEERADYFSSLAHKILDYESTPFPDPLVEKTNPHAVAISLGMIQKVDEHGRPHPAYTQEQIDNRLAEMFGDDWRERYRKW
jgi:hypothetical protein